VDLTLSSALEVVRRRLGGRRPSVAVVLGSGLGGLADALQSPDRISYGELPGFPAPAVAGHTGELVAGELAGAQVLCQSGRLHAYEGHAPEVVALPVRLFADLGIETLIVTNAAGGIAPALGPGAIMLLADHINLTFLNPLHGPVRPGELRFPDMSAAYDPELGRIARDVARAEKIPLEEGVYAGVGGPSYETPAEIGMLRRLGADAVGMSTVLEVVAARARGMRCLGFSTIANRAAGLGSGRLSHQDVLAAARAAGDRLGRLVTGVVSRLSAAG
jgi:purine-nucleoside phosphorylase